jgi:glycosyltransferase involved in cell wall biosynthesis
LAMSQHLRVTQLFDCAEVGRTFVAEARRQGKPWRIIQGPWTRGGTQAAYYRFRLEQAVAYPRTDIWHVNMGGRARWARGFFARPYALTLHGTDIRESYWQVQYHQAIKEDIDLAGQVWYSTPDLREKAERARPDAEYLPAPVDIDELPPWSPAPKPRVFFPSRWDESKGGDDLLQAAIDVIAAVGRKGDVDVVGLNWGNRAEEAARLGVRLLPRMARDEFLRELSSAHVAVGEVSGIVGVSELQAIGIGVPTVIANPRGDRGAELAAVCVERPDVGPAVAESLLDPLTLSRQLNGPAYIRTNHAASVLLPKLEAGYAKLRSQ